MDCLIDPSEAISEVRQTRNEKARPSRVEAQIVVTGAGGGFWKKAFDWGRVNRKRFPREAQVIGACASHYRLIPTEFHCYQAASILERLMNKVFWYRPNKIFGSLS